MAKKKRRKRHRHPVAPPVHSAPGTAYAPPSPRPPEPAPARPIEPGPPPPAAEERAGIEVTPRRRERPARRPRSRRRRRNRRPYFVIGGIVLAIVAALVVQQVMSRRASAAFDRIASAAGCGDLRVTSGSGAGAHLGPGERTTYDTSPPTHGEHPGAGRIPAGVYQTPFSSDPNAENNIYLAVHSLEHGYVIVWHNGLSEDERTELENEYRGANKVIVVPYPQLERGDKMALTAWARIVTCSKPDTGVVDAFVERFREARSAPERLQP